MSNQTVISILQSHLPNLMAIYAFGSRVSGDANANSDWDLAVLVAGYVGPGVLWELSGTLADVTGTDVDLFDSVILPECSHSKRRGNAQIERANTHLNRWH